MKSVVSTRPHALIAVVFLGLSSLLTFSFFTTIPPATGFGFEEEQTAFFAEQFINHRDIPLEHRITNSIASFSFLLFKPGFISLRLLFGILGSLTVPLLFLTLNEYTGLYPAIAATSLFLFSRWHLFGSRIADELFSGMFLEVLALYLLMKALKGNSWWLTILLGISLGLIGYEYFGYRLSFLFIPIAYVVVRTIKIQKIKQYKKSFGQIFVLFLTSLTVLNPLIQAYRHGDDTLVEGFRRHGNARINQSYTPLPVLVRSHFTEIIPPRELIYQRALELWKVMTFGKSGVVEFGQNIPLFDPVTAILVIVSLAYTLLTFYKPWRIFFLAWVILGLAIAAFFPVNFYPARFSPLLPLLFILISFLLQDVFLLIFKIRNTKVFPLVVFTGLSLLFFSFYTNAHRFFIEQPLDPTFQDIFKSERLEQFCDGMTQKWYCMDQQLTP